MRRLTALGALALLMATAGCQGHKPQAKSRPQAPHNASAQQLITTAYERMLAAGSARFGFDQRSTVKGRPSSVTGLGVIDFAGGNLDFTLSAPRIGSLRTVKIGTFLYARLPPTVSGALGGKHWVKVDVSAIADPKLAALVKQLQGSNTDPADILTYLRGVSPGVREVGTEAIRGEQTTHYAATVNTAKALAQMGPDAASAFRQLIRASGTEAFPVDVWLDSANLVRQVVSDIPAAGRAALVVTVQFYDFGASVAATPPPVADTADLAALADLATR